LQSTPCLPRRRGHAAGGQRKPRLRRHDIASRCRLHRGRHEIFAILILGVSLSLAVCGRDPVPKAIRGRKVPLAHKVPKRIQGVAESKVQPVLKGR
jgi:hypothetical protein